MSLLVQSTSTLTQLALHVADALDIALLHPFVGCAQDRGGGLLRSELEVDHQGEDFKGIVFLERQNNNSAAAFILTHCSAREPPLLQQRRLGRDLL